MLFINQQFESVFITANNLFKFGNVSSASPFLEVGYSKTGISRGIKSANIFLKIPNLKADMIV